MRRYVIIGMGPAGIAAAEAIRNQDASGDVLFISDDPHGYYSRPGLAYYLTGEIPEAMLFPWSDRDFKRIETRILHARAVRIDPSTHQVLLHNGQKIIYDRLLIATGAKAAPLKATGSDLEGVFKLDNLEDARHILKLARKSRTAVVVGGGITALEIVEALVSRGIKTHYFLRGDRYWSNVLDETESKIVEQRLQEEGVVIHYHTELGEILGKKGKIAGVRTKDGRQIPCDMLGFAIGIAPRYSLAEISGIRTDRGILVSDCLETSAPDIYAAGDVAQVFDPLTGQSVLDSLWHPAREQGRTAGLNMAGQAASYYKPIAFNVTRLASLTTTIIGAVGRGDDSDIIGIARGDSETWRKLPDAIAAQSDFDVNRLRVLVGQRTLLGGIVMGDQTLSQALHHLILHQADITPIREQLLQPNAPLADILADLWSERKPDYASTSKS
jgi:3-phenylpropionate/trans-cinnamate dioxygenase ferredoxin reductase component